MSEKANIELRSLSTPELRMLAASCDRSGRGRLGLAVADELERRHGSARAERDDSGRQPRGHAAPPPARGSHRLAKASAFVAVLVLTSGVFATRLDDARWPKTLPVAPPPSQQGPDREAELASPTTSPPEAAPLAAATTPDATPPSLRASAGRLDRPTPAAAIARRPEPAPRLVVPDAAVALNRPALEPRQRLDAGLAIAPIVPAREGRIDVSRAQLDLERSAPRHGCAARMASSEEALCADARELATSGRSDGRIKLPDKTDLARAISTDDRRPR